MSGEVKKEIMAAIASDGEVAQRTLLKLMLMVLDEIGGKIDVILQDEVSLRHAVLNGHTDQHEAHHDWVEAQISKEAANAASGRKIRDGLVEKALWAAMAAAAMWMVMK